MARLAAARPRRAPPAGVRIVLDARPMQEPERGPLSAEYLERLLAAFAAEPLEGESFVVISRALQPDPAVRLAGAGLPVAAGRRLPPTGRVLRSAGLTLDSFLLRGAEFGTDSGTGAVFHTVAGAVPIASRLPVVATLLDLAPWELPDVYAASAAARFGHRLRTRILRDAARVIVCSRQTAETARRRLHVPAERLVIVPLAVDAEFIAAGRHVERVADIRARFGLPPRYLVFSGRYDARKDMRTLFAALRLAAERVASGETRDGRRRSPSTGAQPAGPPLLVFAARDGGPADDAAIERAAQRGGAAELVRRVPALDPADRAALIAGAEAFVYPSLSEATALPVLEALAVGVPVVCSRVGALPESVGSAGIVVEPRDPVRLAAAMEAIWSGGSLAQQLRRQAHRRAESTARSWSDVAYETRRVYAAAAGVG